MSLLYSIVKVYQTNVFLAINLTIFQFHVNNDDFQFDLNTNQVSIEMTFEFVLQ